MKINRLFWCVLLLNVLVRATHAQLSPTPRRAALVVLGRQVLTQSPEDQVLTIPGLLKRWERQSLPFDTTYVTLTLELARAYSQMDNRLAAIQLLKKIIGLYQSGRSVGAPEDLVKAYHRLSGCQREMGNLSAARTTAEAGIRVGVGFPRSRWISHLYGTLAFILGQTGDYEKSVHAADQGIYYGEQAHDSFGIANGLFEKSKALTELGRIAETRPYLERAIQLIETDPRRAYDLSMYYVRLAYVYQDEKKTALSLTYFRRGIALNRSLEDSLGLGNNDIDLGNFLYEQGQYDQAIAPLLEAVNCHPLSSGKARAFNNLGGVYWKKKAFAQSLKAYDQGISLLLGGLQNKSAADMPTEETVRFLAHKEFFLSLIQDKADTWLDWGKTTGNRTYLRHALETYQLADKMIDFMRWEHTGTGSKLYWRQKTRGLYERAIETCYRLGDTEQAYRFFEKSRAVMLTDKLNELGAHRQLTPAQAAQEEKLRQQLTERQTQLAALKPDTKAYTETRLKLSAEQEQFDGFIKQIEQSNPAYYRYKFDNTTRSLAEVQHWLGERSASLVSYFVGDSALYSLGVTQGRAQLLRQPVARYRQAAGEFRQLLSDPTALNRQYGRYQTLSFDLYQQLLAPLKLPDGRVVVSPDGSFLPFESLSRSTGLPDLLVNHYAISYAYSARLLLKDRLTTTPDRDFLGMAPVQFGAGLSTLPGSDVVLQRIGQQFGSATLLTGAGATRRAFREQAPGCRVIQLFTHADAGSEPTEGTVPEPVLYFADSTLRLSEIASGTPFQAELLVLSACKTGAGVNQQGEGVFSLARGFAAVGVPSVLTTLWSVDNQVTYRLTELFYKHLNDGMPKDVALQRAKQEFLQTASRAEQLPTHWAGLILVGNAEPLPEPLRWPYAVGGGTLLLGSIGWMTRRRQKVIRKAVNMR